MARVVKRSHWQLWSDVIFALFVRRLRSQFNDKLGFSWAVLQPLFIIAILSMVRGSVDGGETHSIPTMIFLMIGLVPVKAFIASWGTLSSSIKQDKPLYSFRQVQPISSLITTLIFQALINAVVILLLCGIIYLMQIKVQMAEPLLIIMLYFELFVICFSLGTIFAVIECFIPEVGKIRALFSMPLLFISGVFFSLKDIDPEYWAYLNWNPILHIIELSRQACYPSFIAEGVSMNFVHGVTLVLLFTSLATYQALWKQAISR